MVLTLRDAFRQDSARRKAMDAGDAFWVRISVKFGDHGVLVRKISKNRDWILENDGFMWFY